VTLPELTSLRLSGASRGSIHGFNTSKDLDLHVAVASHLTGDIEVSRVEVNAVGASHVSLSGSVQDAAVHAWMASHVKLAELRAENVGVQAHGASHVTVNAGGHLEATASTASHVRYLGQPEFGRVQTLLASTLRPDQPVETR
jgi:hypothetical protein